MCFTAICIPQLITVAATEASNITESENDTPFDGTNQPAKKCTFHSLSHAFFPTINDAARHRHGPFPFDSQNALDRGGYDHEGPTHH